MIYGLEDYKLIFDLKQKDLEKKILEFPAGFSSFNTQMHGLGYHIVSADPLYQYDQAQLRDYAQVNLSEDDFYRAKKMLNDFGWGKESGRYVAADSPEATFSFHQFDLLLCHDWVFKTNPEDVLFQEERIRQLAGLAQELRIFPLTNDQGENAEALAPVMLSLQKQGFDLEVKDVGFQFEKNGHVMLKVSVDSCDVES